MLVSPNTDKTAVHGCHSTGTFTLIKVTLTGMSLRVGYQGILLSERDLITSLNFNGTQVLNATFKGAPSKRAGSAGFIH